MAAREPGNEARLYVVPCSPRPSAVYTNEIETLRKRIQEMSNKIV